MGHDIGEAGSVTFQGGVGTSKEGGGKAATHANKNTVKWEGEKRVQTRKLSGPLKKMFPSTKKAGDKTANSQEQNRGVWKGGWLREGLGKHKDQGEKQSTNSPGERGGETQRLRSKSSAHRRNGFPQQEGWWGAWKGGIWYESEEKGGRGNRY